MAAVTAHRDEEVEREPPDDGNPDNLGNNNLSRYDHQASGSRRQD